MKSVYILTGRERNGKSQIPNTVKHIIGVFTTPKKAQKWIATEGKTFYPRDWKKYKNYFWALCKYVPDENSGVWYEFYDLE